MNRTAVLTDTNSGIGAEEAEALGVHLLAMPVIVDGVSRYEGADLTEESLCALLRQKAAVSTSQPAMGDVIDKWEELLAAGYEEIVYIPMSSGLSSSCACATAAAAAYGGRIRVADNRRISVTQRAAVLEALRMAGEGRRAAEIGAALERDAANSSIYVCVEDIAFLRRGGRVTAAGAALASVLGIRPILSIRGGKLDAFAKLRGHREKCEERMLEAIAADIAEHFSHRPIRLLRVGAAGFGITPKEQEAWLARTRAAFPGAEVYYDPLPASIGVHTGPGAVGIGVSVEYAD